MRWAFCILLILCFCLGPVSRAQAPDSTGQTDALTEVPFSQLSDPGNSILGQAALAVRAADWRHAETDHFILHFFHNFVAAQVAGELEYYYHAISTELHQDTTTWERKGHVYIFESQEDWHSFQKNAQLDPWTGGLHNEGNLYIVRDPSNRFQGRSLGHETAHMVLYRFYGAAIPLWLNEGYAENSSIRFYAGLEKERGYRMPNRSVPITASNYIPLPALTTMATYPEDVTQIPVFYQESEKLVAFLRAQSVDGFNTFLDATAHGARMDTALSRGFGGRFPSVADLDQEFSQYAERQYQPLAGD
jgi:hypothetical protein